MSGTPSRESKSLVTIASENPAVSIPLFAGAISLVSAAALVRNLVDGLVRHRGLPPGGNILPAVYLLFVCGVLAACVLALRRLVVRNGWPATLGLLHQLMAAMPLLDRITVWLIGAAVLGAVGAFLLL